ncbi:hypothetical protein H5P35_10195 [Mycobacterium haemophilum DSM 44634]|nr:hypothetical protein [Mycobacterium haemophilum DSM 44634]
MAGACRRFGYIPPSAVDMYVHGVVVQDQMYGKVFGYLLVDGAQELQEL